MSYDFMPGAGLIRIKPFRLLYYNLPLLCREEIVNAEDSAMVRKDISNAQSLTPTQRAAVR